MGGAWKLSALPAAALCAALLAACGGGGGDSTSTAPTAQTTAEAPSEQGGDKGGGSGDGGGSKADGKNNVGSKGGDNAGGSKGGSKGGAGGGSKGGGKNGGGSTGVSDAGFHFSGKPTKHKHPAPVEGSRADGFRVPGGDNSIQEFGTEQGADERAAAMLPIAALYKALFTSDWNEVCDTYLSANNVQQIKLLSEKSPQIKGKGCAEVLGSLNQSNGVKGPDTPDGGVVSFRVDGDTGFAIYWGIDGKGYAFPLKSEGGGWKLTSLAPTPLQVG
jgi:hypothetical protein